VSETAAPETVVDELLRRRTETNERFFEAEAERIGRLCQALAERFTYGGRLLAVGDSPQSRSDAHHVAVEFVHPVIVGKRALPAISLTTDVATVTGIAEREGMDAIFSHQLRYLAAPSDIALGICATGDCGSVLAGLATARQLGMLTIALAGGDGGAIAAGPAADHVLLARSGDPRVVKEMHVTMYHLLWELVHVFLEQPGTLSPGVFA
jgi:D-sedoheptulose 7-phosphate isomerase